MLVSINKLSVDKMGEPFLLAELNGLGNQCVHWSLVVMRIHREDMKQCGHAAHINHLQETDEFLIPIGAHERAPVQIRGKLSSDGFQVFSEMPETSALANGRFIVNRVDPLYEIVTKRDNLHRHAALGSAPDILP